MLLDLYGKNALDWVEGGSRRKREESIEPLKNPVNVVNKGEIKGSMETKLKEVYVDQDKAT
jgi:hypothetical protein